MGWTDQSDKDRVLESTDLVALISEHVSLKSKGREFVGLCPFHDDRNPSMTVAPHKQIFKCFVCGAGGDALSFVSMYYKLTFPEALRMLADRAGIELKPRRRDGRLMTASDEPSGPSQRDLASVNELACRFYQLLLEREGEGAEARATLERRGVSPEMIERFALGVSPDRWDGLVETMRGKDVDVATLLAAGLARQKEGRGGGYDAFRRRLMFPIHDQMGRVVAFGARKLREEDEPKYLNSPETALFKKSGTLYGIRQAARAISEKRLAIVTEGYTDVIACHQAGIEHVVGTLGTALTGDHARVLRRLCDTIVLLFDGDEAGQRAADRAVEVFFAEPVDVRIATLSSVTDAKDPDELLKREGGAETLAAAIDRAIDAVEFRLARLGARLAGLGLSARATAVDEEIGRLCEMGLGNVAPLRKSLICRRLAQLLGVEEQVVLKTVAQKALRKRRVAQLAEPKPDASSEIDEMLRGAAWPVGAHLLGALLIDPSLALALDADARAIVRGAIDEIPGGSALGEAVWSALDAGRQPTLASVLRRTDDEPRRRLATSVVDRLERMTEGDADRLRAHWSSKLSEARRRREEQAPAPEDDWIAAIRRERAGLQHEENRARIPSGENAPTLNPNLASPPAVIASDPDAGSERKNP